MSAQGRFARAVEAGIRSGAVNPRGHLNTGPAQDRICNHPLATGDEEHASGYVTVARATGKATTRGGMLLGTVTGLSATVAVTGKTVTGTNRKTLLTALVRAHNAHLAAR